MRAAHTTPVVSSHREARVVSRRPASSRLRALDALLDEEHAALVPRYESAGVPAIEDLRGPLRGRMLAVPMLPAAVASQVRRFAGSDTFPWRGKTFTPRDAHAGEGMNRVFSDALELFRFETSIGPSRHDGAPAFQLDYDLPENPGLIRRIEDEVRELEPGLWLGQAWLRSGAKLDFVLWFALADATD